MSKRRERQEKTKRQRASGFERWEW